jgi:hypothetical protein
MPAQQGESGFSGLDRERVRQQIDGPQRTRLAVHRKLRTIGIAPDLRGEKSHKKTEEQPHRGNDPGDTALNACARRPVANAITPT